MSPIIRINLNIFERLFSLDFLRYHCPTITPVKYRFFFLRSARTEPGFAIDILQVYLSLLILSQFVKQLKVRWPCGSGNNCIDIVGKDCSAENLPNVHMSVTLCYVSVAAHSLSQLTICHNSHTCHS